MVVNIPEPHKSAVAAMAEIDVAARQALLTALDLVPPASSMQQLGAHLASAADIPQKYIRATLYVMEVLIGAEVTSDENRRTFANGIAEAAARGGLAGLTSEDHDAIDSFAQFVLALMERKRVFDFAIKVTSLLYDHKNIYKDAWVFTDFRPLFDDSIQPTDLKAGVIFHTLRLAMMSQGSEDSDLYVALDTADLLSLRSVLDRAIIKNQLLRQRLTALEIPLNDSDE